MKRKKPVRKDKPEREKWVVVDWQGRMKYPAPVGQAPVGFDEELARQLAEPAHESHAFRAVPLSDLSA